MRVCNKHEIRFGHPADQPQLRRSLSETFKKKGDVEPQKRRWVVMGSLLYLYGSNSVVASYEYLLHHFNTTN